MKTYIIAEAGVNHNGDLTLAKQLIEVASEAGANAVKFQTFQAEKLVTRLAEKADYQKQVTSAQESQFEMIKKLELNVEAHHELMKYCRQCSIQFLSTPFDLESIDLLAGLQLPLFKIPSGEITNLPYLRHIAQYKNSVIMSTGMASLGEVEEALSVLENGGIDRKQITILHCSTEYPTPMEDVNLKAMQTIASAFPGVQVGYSDHTLGIEVSVAAVAMGASVIEKHFTLDKTMEGPDHKASLEPGELKAMVKAIRNIETAMGSGIKAPTPSELKNKSVVRKSIIALKSIKKDETLTEENIGVKRPGTGINPMRWNEIIGSKAKRSFIKDELIGI
ncbi:MAG: N-acetylneuraminate synthase [Desulfamplus sp.]|nr:N-acetylneuraminate synthase [Desulfamplus sp.]